MIVVRFKVRCRPEKTEEALSVFEKVVAPSRALDGVVSFDLGRDLADPDSIFAMEVFEDRAALDRQEALPEVTTVLGLLPELVTAEPEGTIFEVASSVPY